jgi:hypothetical protein
MHQPGSSNSQLLIVVAVLARATGSKVRRPYRRAARRRGSNTGSSSSTRRKREAVGMVRGVVGARRAMISSKTGSSGSNRWCRSCHSLSCYRSCADSSSRDLLTLQVAAVGARQQQQQGWLLLLVVGSRKLGLVLPVLSLQQLRC